MGYVLVTADSAHFLMVKIIDKMVSCGNDFADGMFAGPMLAEVVVNVCNRCTVVHSAFFGQNEDDGKHHIDSDAILPCGLF